MTVIFCVITFRSQISLAEVRGEVIPVSDTKYRAIKKVYDSVARALSDHSRPPALVLIPRGDAAEGGVSRHYRGTEGLVGVQTRYEEARILIDERAYDSLARLGFDRDNALAFLLGHELVHFYRQEGRMDTRLDGFAGNRLASEQAQGESGRRVSAEVEADYFGALYSYLAGYDSLPVAAKMLDLLYAEYRLPKNPKNYPALKDRKAVVELAAENLRNLFPLFDAATTMLLAGVPEPAGQLFQYLTKTAPSKEVFNNAGMAFANAALLQYSEMELPFAYPLEFDLSNRLKPPATKGFDPSQEPLEKRRELLEQALDNLDRALRLDPRYLPAMINRSVVHDLLGYDHDDVLSDASKAIDIARKSGDRGIEGNALIIRGILFAKEGNRTWAREDFNAAASTSPVLSPLNLARLEGKRYSVVSTQKKTTNSESIYGITPDRLESVRNVKKSTITLKTVNGKKLDVRLFSPERQEWSGMILDIGKNRFNVISTGSSAGETVQGIKRGDTLAKVTVAYGEPERSISTRGGRFIMYDGAGIVFSLGDADGVRGWTIFSR